MSLKGILAYLSRVLPVQGPLKDFIHRNLLQGFQDLPFSEGVERAGAFYGSNIYMPLAFYHQAFKDGEIDEKKLAQSIRRFCQNDKQRALLRSALFGYIDFKDEQSAGRSFNPEILSEISKHMVFDEIKKIRPRCAQQIGEDWEAHVNPVLFRLTSAFLDQGIVLWNFPSANLGFFEAVRKLAEHSWLPLAPFIKNRRFLAWFDKKPAEIIEEILVNIVGDKEHFDSYAAETLMAHPGWSGLVNYLDIRPNCLVRARSIHLMDFLACKLILEWEYIQSTCLNWKSLAQCTDERENHSRHLRALSLVYLFSKCPTEDTEGELKFCASIRPSLLGRIWHEAYEDTYYDTVLAGVKYHALHPKKKANRTPVHIQALFCIDDRECSFRRYLEELDPQVETFATAGFFGIDFFFQSLNDAFPKQLCPFPLKPKHVVKERPAHTHHYEFAKQKMHNEKAAVSLQRWHDASGSLLLGFVAANALGHLSMLKLIAGLFRPKMLIHSLHSRQIDVQTELTLLNSDDQQTKDSVQHGFTHNEMAMRVFSVLTSIGLTKNFAPLVVCIAHGSSSMNNPHFAAYDCGACSGNPGAPNARAFAMMANMSQVRSIVEQKGINIPVSTRFMGGYHDTTTDSVHFFDVEDQELDPAQRELYASFLNTIDNARALNAKERCRRFELVSLDISPSDALLEVNHRASMLFEPRPELGHQKNSICIVGPRATTKGLFLDRRAFFQSYDPKSDSDGSILGQILGAVIPVCGGINLDYFFSLMDSATYGSGSKLSHNVCALLGVYNGMDDDLRTALPVQMTELHEPIRLLNIIEQTPEIVDKAMRMNPEVFQWIDHEWVKLACLDPQTRQLYWYYPQNGFVLIDVPLSALPVAEDSASWVACSRKNLPMAQI